MKTSGTAEQADEKILKTHIWNINLNGFRNANISTIPESRYSSWETGLNERKFARKFPNCLSLNEIARNIFNRINVYNYLFSLRVNIELSWALEVKELSIPPSNAYKHTALLSIFIHLLHDTPKDMLRKIESWKTRKLCLTNMLRC